MFPLLAGLIPSLSWSVPPPPRRLRCSPFLPSAVRVPWSSPPLPLLSLPSLPPFRFCPCLAACSRSPRRLFLSFCPFSPLPFSALSSPLFLPLRVSPVPLFFVPASPSVSVRFCRSLSPLRSVSAPLAPLFLVLLLPPPSSPSPPVPPLGFRFFTPLPRPAPCSLSSFVPPFLAGRASSPCSAFSLPPSREFIPPPRLSYACSYSATVPCLCHRLRPCHPSLGTPLLAPVALLYAPSSLPTLGSSTYSLSFGFGSRSWPGHVSARLPAIRLALDRYPFLLLSPFLPPPIVVFASPLVAARSPGFALFAACHVGFLRSLSSRPPPTGVGGADTRARGSGSRLACPSPWSLPFDWILFGIYLPNVLSLRSMDKVSP